VIFHGLLEISSRRESYGCQIQYFTRWIRWEGWSQGDIVFWGGVKTRWLQTTVCTACAVWVLAGLMVNSYDHLSQLDGKTAFEIDSVTKVFTALFEHRLLA